MTAKEFVSHLAPVDPERLARIFNFLAEHAHELRLVTGERLNDCSDFAAFHREVAAALLIPRSTDVQSITERRPAPKVTQRPAQPRWESTCTKCGHVHEGDGECGVSLGKGGCCDCKSEVTA